MLSREERLAAARKRTQQSIDNKNSFGNSGADVLDYSKVGGKSKELFYHPKPGMNHIDIVPYLVSTNNHPQKLPVGTPDYLLDVFVHRFVGASKGSYLCLQAQFGKPCPICEERERMKTDPSAPEDAYKKLFPKRRTFYTVFNTDLPERDQKPQIFEEVHFWFEQAMLDVVAVKNEFEFWDIEEGKNIEFMLTEKKTPEGTSKTYGQFYFAKRQPYTEAVYKEAFPLDAMLIVPTYEEVLAAYLSVDVDELDGSKEEKQGEPQDSRRSTAEAPQESRRRAPEPAEDKGPFDDSALPFKDDAPQSRRQRSQATTAEPNPCPFGHEFGKDNEKYLAEGHCSQCDQAIWNKCAAIFDELNPPK